MLPRCIPGRPQAFRHAIQRAAKTKKSPSNFLWHHRHALYALRNQIDFLIVQCDKNLGPSVIECVEYVQMAIRDHLSDTNTYRCLSRFEATLAAGHIRLSVKEWIVRHKNVLTKNERKFIPHCINTNKDPFAAFYLTMKVHKTHLKSCLIVSCSGSLLFALGKLVDDKLKIFAHRQPAYFKSSQDLQTMLSTMVIPPHTFFFTAEAKSMYTNIDTNLALAYISSYIRDHAAEFEFYSFEALVEALKIVMKKSSVTFGDTYWRQDSGTAMGTPPAPQWANILYALCQNQFAPISPKPHLLQEVYRGRPWHVDHHRLCHEHRLLGILHPGNELGRLLPHLDCEPPLPQGRLHGPHPSYRWCLHHHHPIKKTVQLSSVHTPPLLSPTGTSPGHGVWHAIQDIHPVQRPR
jgi:hypothetical protein